MTIPNDFDGPPPVMTQATRQNELKAEYQRGLEEGRMQAIEELMQAMKCQSAKHPPECGCTDEMEWIRKRLSR